MTQQQQAPQTRTGTKVGVAAIIAAAVAISAPLAERWEGFASKPYLDPAAIPTYCYGETENVQKRTYSREECGVLLRARQSRDYAPKVLACLPELRDERRAPVFAALIDAAYNAGPAAVCNSPMARHIRANQWRAACDAFPGWYVTARNRVTGVRVKLRGLERRREDERRTCLKGI